MKVTRSAGLILGFLAVCVAVFLLPWHRHVVASCSQARDVPLTADYNNSWLSPSVLPPIYRADPLPDAPDICIAVLSSRRWDLLERTLRSTVEHLETAEPELKYEIALVDQAQVWTQAEAFQRDFIDRYEVNSWLISPGLRSEGWGLNLLYFSMCRAPYILSIEDDWEWRAGQKEPLLRQAIEVLEDQPANLGVDLNSAHLGNYQYGWFADDTYRVSARSGVVYRQITGHAGGQEDGLYRLRYVTGGVLLKATALKAIGRLCTVGRDAGCEHAEPEYKRRALKAGYCLSWLATKMPAGPLATDPGIKIAYDHIGGGRQLSGHAE